MKLGAFNAPRLPHTGCAPGAIAAPFSHEAFRQRARGVPPISPPRPYNVHLRAPHHPERDTQSSTAARSSRGNHHLDRLKILRNSESYTSAGTAPESATSLIMARIRSAAAASYARNAPSTSTSFYTALTAAMSASSCLPYRA